jgi:simple sugar transport system substrate-binding protein
MRKWRFLVAALASLFLIAIVGFKAEAQSTKPLTLYYDDHGIPTTGMLHPFWPEYYRGIKDAAAMLAPLGVVVKHLSAVEDLVIQTAMLKKVVEANPDGLVTTMIDPKSFESILKPLVDKGVPIMAANVDDPRPVGQRIPYLTYYGQDSEKTGADLADAIVRYFKETGGQKPQFALLCNPAAWHHGWETLLNRFGEGLTKEYGTQNEKIVSVHTEEIIAYLAKNPKVDVICAQALFIHELVGQLKSIGKTPGKDIFLVSVDLASQTPQEIKDGKVVAGSDQQEYLQGFLPLMDLYLYLTKYKVHPLEVVTTGPIIWDRNNVESVMEGASAGYR